MRNLLLIFPFNLVHPAAFGDPAYPVIFVFYPVGS